MRSQRKGIAVRKPASEPAPDCLSIQFVVSAERRGRVGSGLVQQSVPLLMEFLGRFGIGGGELAPGIKRIGWFRRALNSHEIARNFFCSLRPFSAGRATDFLYQFL